MTDCGATTADLPSEFSSVASATQQLAIDTACAALPCAALIAWLGAAKAKTIQINAASHVLVRWGHGSSTESTVVSERIGDVSTHYANASGASGTWAGSPYGEAVAAALALLPRRTARGRRPPIAVPEVT